jgi:hypothetical protein
MPCGIEDLSHQVNYVVPTTTAFAMLSGLLVRIEMIETTKRLGDGRY